MPDEFADYDFFPAYAFTKILFRIFLPRRLQNELDIFAEEDDPVETEYFNVLITYAHPVPFTAIFYPCEENAPSPSRAVSIIRRYLERHFSDNQVDFRSAGPSPFHANFVLGPGTGPTAASDAKFLINDISERGAGYRRYEIKYRSEEENIQYIFRELIEYVQPFFATYYTLERDRINQIYISEEVNSELQKLQETERRSWLIRIFKQFFGASEIVRSIFTSLLDMQFEKSRTDKFFSEQSRDENLLNETPLYYFIERIRADYPVFPSVETRELVLLFESRRLKLTENRAVLVAGLLGGVLGALLTWAISTHGDHDVIAEAPPHNAGAPGGSQPSPISPAPAPLPPK